MAKIYVLDTNVLLHDPESLFSFDDNRIILPLSIIEELDQIKRRVDDVGRNAREASRKLDALRMMGHLAEGVKLPKGGSIKIELNGNKPCQLLDGIDLSNVDNRILALAYNLTKTEDDRVILVTKDLNLRIKADVLGILTEDFYSDKVDYDKLYSGVCELQLDDVKINKFYQDGCIDHKQETIFPNQFCILKAPNNPSASALARFSQNRLQKLIFEGTCVFGIRPLNKEQKFALDLLLDDNVEVVTLVGRAGTGKTILALAAGLDKVFEDGGRYNRLLITRPIVPLGNDLGFLPGDKEEKIRPWMQPIYDNLELLCNEHVRPNASVNYLLSSEKIELEPLTYIRGRSIPRQFIICDESQNLSPHVIKTILTRIGKGSKIVFTGDPEQIDHPYLDASSNGLSYLVERIRQENISGHITLVKGERSGVAELGARLL
jgi:PhoH-like ATPase